MLKIPFTSFLIHYHQNSAFLIIFNITLIANITPDPKYLKIGSKSGYGYENT